MLKSLKNIFKFALIKFKQLSLKTQIIFFISTVTVLCLLIIFYKNATKESAFQLETAIIGSITEFVSETGNVTTTGSIPIYSTTTGIVEEVFVKNGDYVEKDTALFKVISTASQQEKDSALSAYLAANAALETAKATQLSLQATMLTEWDQFKELAQSDDYEDSEGKPRYDQRGLPEFHVPEKEWLASEAMYKKQQIVISQASANKSATWQAYQATKDSEVKAILGGEIKNLGIAKGDMVTINNVINVVSSPPVLVIYNNDVKTIIKVDVDETEVVKIKVDQPVVIDFDAFPKQSLSGHIDRIDSIAIPASGVVKYPVYIVLDQTELQIKGGMTADVDIVVNIKEDVLTVSSSAVKPYEGGRAVRIVGKNKEIEFVPVETGIKGNGRIEIISGINEGDQIIMALKNEQVSRASTGFF